MPFVSKRQQHFLYAHPEKIGKDALHEWSSKTNFKTLPEKAPAKKKDK
jgi:hypothetical protein